MIDFNRFVASYYDRFMAALRGLDQASLVPVLDVLTELSRSGKTLWIAGNGGSASLADHAACDLAKGTHFVGHVGGPVGSQIGPHAPIRAISLASNPAMLTAIANDIAFDQIYRKQLEIYLREGDAVLLASASGDSPNVVEACLYARSRGVTTIAFVGFKGGRLKALADHVVHVEVENYGMSEDIHQSLMHVLSQYIAFVRSQGRSS